MHLKMYQYKLVVSYFIQCVISFTTITNFEAQCVPDLAMGATQAGSCILPTSPSPCEYWHNNGLLPIPPWKQTFL